jgi:thiosulfate dehydrogenase [quinone] large subunit
MVDQGWYDWFAWLVIGGEILLGLGLIRGGLVGIAAFFGAIMNLNFMLVGTASTNPVLFSVGIVLILAWKVVEYLVLGHRPRPALDAGRDLETGTADPAAKSGKGIHVDPALLSAPVASGGFRLDHGTARSLPELDPG